MLCPHAHEGDPGEELGERDATHRGGGNEDGDEEEPGGEEEDGEVKKFQAEDCGVFEVL